MRHPPDRQDADPSAAKHEQLQLVTFGLAGHEFAIDILAVREISRVMPLTRLPLSPPEVEGVANLRGQIIPIVDLRRRFGLEPAERNEHSRVVIVEIDSRVAGLIVDRVHEVLRIARDAINPAPGTARPIDPEFIAGVGKLDDRLIILLDTSTLFSDDLAAAAAKAA